MLSVSAKVDALGTRDEPSPTPARRVTVRRGALTGTALAGVAALLLTTALPISFGSGGQDAPASAFNPQTLGTTGSWNINPGPVIGLGAETSDSPGSFTNYRDASVQFPFASTVPLTDRFGERSYPVSGFHDAQDFAAEAGTSVQSIAAGTVLEAGWATDGCGFGVKVAHQIDGQQVTSRYCHMQADSSALNVGQVIPVAEPVGKVGATGWAFGAHLHFALTVAGKPTDPLPYLSRYNISTRPRLTH